VRAALAPRLRSAFLAAGLVLPVSGLAAVGADGACNHLQGDIVVAEDGTPRGNWCAAVQWHWHWLLLVFVPALVTLVLALAAGRRRPLRVAAWGLGVVLALAPVLVLGQLRAYYEI